MLTTNIGIAGKILYPYVYLHKAFTDEHLFRIEEICSNLPIEEGITMDKENSYVRESQVAWLKPSSETNWFFDEYFKRIVSLNRDFYNFDLTGFDSFQYTIYHSKGSKYDDHMDLNMSENHHDHLHRKLSSVLFLQDKSEYEGGEFQILPSTRKKEIINVEQKRGTLVCFPSWMLHRVKPITSGSRRSLVAWVLGPTFR